MIKSWSWWWPWWSWCWSWSWSGLFPTYFLHMEREEGRSPVFLLAGRKRKKWIFITINKTITINKFIIIIIIILLGGREKSWISPWSSWSSSSLLSFSWSWYHWSLWRCTSSTYLLSTDPTDLSKDCSIAKWKSSSSSVSSSSACHHHQRHHHCCHTSFSSLPLSSYIIVKMIDF